MLSADATRLAQLTKNFIKNTTTTEKKKDSTLELAALQSNITKREIIMDEDPDVVLKMGGKEAQLQQEKVKKAEEVYRFARQVLDIVDNNNNAGHLTSKRKVKRGLNNGRRTDTDKKTIDHSGNIKGIWAGLGSIPEFEPDLVRRDTYTHDDSQELRLKTSQQQQHHHTMSLQEIRQKRDEFNSGKPRHHKRSIMEDKETDYHDLNANKMKRSNSPPPSSDKQHMESPLSVTETGSLGTVNLRQIRRDTITNEVDESTQDNIQHVKTKRQDVEASSANNNGGIINRMTAPATSNDGKVIFAFDEVKELLPARLSQSVETDGRGQVSLLKPQTITETRYDDMDKDLAESMVVSRENIPFKQGTTTSNTAVLTAQLYPESSPSITTGSTENQQQKNKIPILKKENRIGPAQFSKYRSNYERPRMEQMQRWINETMLHPLGNEQTEETDAALQKLNLASLNTSTPYPSYTDSKGETSNEYLAKNLQDKVKTEEPNSEVGIDELNRDILKEQSKYKTYLENQRLERLRDQQKQQHGDDSETQSQSTQNLNSSPSAVAVPPVKQQQKQNTSEGNEIEHMERVHGINSSAIPQQQQQQQQQEKVIDEEGTLEHFEKVHNNSNSSIDNELSSSQTQQPKPNATTAAPTPTTTTTPNSTLPTTNTTSQANATVATMKNATTPVNTTATAPATIGNSTQTATTIAPPALAAINTTNKNVTNNQTQQKPAEQEIANNNNNTTSSYQQTPESNHGNITSSSTTTEEKKNETSINRDNVEEVTNHHYQQQQQQPQQQTPLTPAQQYLDAWQQGNVTNLSTTQQPQQTALASSTTTKTTATPPSPTTSTASHEIQTKPHPYPLDTEYEVELPRNKSAPSIIPRTDGINCCFLK